MLGGWLNSPAAQTTPAEGSQHPCVARHLSRGPVNHPGLRGFRFDFFPFLAVDRNRQSFVFLVEPRRLWAPLRGAEQRRRAGGSRLALFEPQASSGKPPGLPSSAGNPEGAPTQGSPFLCLLSFGEAKESGTPSRRKPLSLQPKIPATRRHPTSDCPPTKTPPQGVASMRAKGVDQCLALTPIHCAPLPSLDAWQTTSTPEIVVLVPMSKNLL